jgi:hypothetical protein
MHLREQDLAADLCIGVASVPMGRKTIHFDHSWLEVAELPLDVAIARPQEPFVPFAPVLFGHHLDDGREADVTYGAPDGTLDADASRVARCSLAEYVDRGPAPGGLWSNAVSLGRSLGLALDADALRRRHGDVRWARRPAAIGLSTEPTCTACGAGFPAWDPAWSASCRSCGRVDHDVERKLRAEVPRTLAAAPSRPRSPSGVRVGRNDPCPCGSGKKFKKCCLA